MANKIGLDQKKVDEVVAFLNGYLADLHALYVKLHNVHWNVEGRHFFKLHERFEEYYDAVNEELDEVAEKILILGGRPVASMADYVKLAGLKEAPSEVYASESAAKMTHDDFTYMIGRLREGIGIAQEAGDETTADMLIGNLARYEKDLWMLRAFLA